MAGDKRYTIAFPTFIALCVIIVVVSSYSWKIDLKSAGLGTTSVDSVNTLAAYDLHSGDTIYYEYESSVTCWFIITTDPLSPEMGEKLNLSGTLNSGLFECQTDGWYYIRVVFLDIPPEGMAEVDYETYALDNSSALAIMVKPIALAVLSGLLTLLVFRAYRGNNEDGYWKYFASRVANWVAIVAGGVMLVAASVFDYLNPTTDLAESVLDWLFEIGMMAVILGLLFGMNISWSEYKKTVR